MGFYKKSNVTAYKKGVATPISEIELIKKSSRSPSSFSIDFVNKGLFFNMHFNVAGLPHNQKVTTLILTKTFMFCIRIINTIFNGLS